MQKVIWSFVVVLATAIACTLFSVPDAWTYGQYDGGCKQSGCHGSFTSGDPSPHSFHQDFVNSCRDCHTQTGDNPDTNSSGNNPDYSCNGCHVEDGLVAHHVWAGESCSPCHNNPNPVGENVLPFYYMANRSDVSDPCSIDSGSGGEDWNNDGFGLDNDGDGIYDAADSDCGTPTYDESWSVIKALFGDE